MARLSRLSHEPLVRYTQETLRETHILAVLKQPEFR
jgi:hypothetical protein